MFNWEQKTASLICQTAKWGIHSETSELLEKCVELLRQLAEADATFMIRIVDDTTAKVEISSETQLQGLIIDSGPIIELMNQCPDHVMLWREIQASDKYDLGDVLEGFSSACVICLEDSGNNAVLVVCWKALQEWDESFKQFAEIAKLRMNEMLWQSNTRLKLDNVFARFNAILQTIPQSVVFVDNGGRKGWVNNQAATLLQLPASGGQQPAVLAAAMARLRNKTLNSKEINEVAASLFSTANGSAKDWIWHFQEPENYILNVSCVPMISTQFEGKLWVFEDVTSLYLANENLQNVNLRLAAETKRADKENKAKSEFLANMSHEIRTPMNGVIGMTSLLMNTRLSDEQHEFVETIRISGETLLTIINDILDFSKIESGNLELESRPLSIQSVIEETFDILALSANKKQLDLLYFIEKDVPAIILGDITRLRQILVNLVSNGIKFTNNGYIYVYVCTVEKDNGQVTLEFMVQDTGIGIPADKFDKLFQNFSQVDSSTTRKYGGTGLGLSICKKLVSLMQGNVRIESEEEKGASFYFTIRSQIGEPATSQPDILLTPFFPGSTKIAVIHNNATVATILKKQFECWGMQADVMQHVKEVVTAVQNNHYDIVLLDLVMPVTDSLLAARKLKEQAYTKHIPLILIRSPLSSQYLDNDKHLFEAILHKPLKYNQLYKSVTRLFATEPVTILPEKITQPLTVPPGRNIRILVAEDNLFNQMVAKKMLETLGYHADMVANGLEALKAALNQPYQLIFMDMQMPEMDGLEASFRIKAEVINPPVIIAMTANHSADDQERCQLAGMLDFVQKPFTLTDMKMVLEKWEPMLTHSF